jgi:hypothetical protein
MEKIGWEAWTQSQSKSEIPEKMVKTNTNAVNPILCGKLKIPTTLGNPEGQKSPMS